LSGYSTSMDDQNLFREAFNQEVIEYLAERLRLADPGLDARRFSRRALDGLEDLSFSDRARNILSGLEAVLPADDFPAACDILVKALGPEPDIDHLRGFDGFYVVPMTMYVSAHGLDQPGVALSALYEMTKRFSAEMDIRPFIQRHYDLTMDFLIRLCDDPSPFARRLASEGTRPRLPLAPRLRRFQTDPRPAIALLDRLYADENLMVRRSVANHINDISKDNPDIAVEVLDRWRNEHPGKRTEWLVRHGLRTLIKRSHAGALTLLGYEPDAVELVSAAADRDEVPLGQPLELRWLLTGKAGGRNGEQGSRLSLNYVIGFVKAGGTIREKVFRLPDKTVMAGGELEIVKTHKFLDYRNQQFYPGVHWIELSVNGSRMGRVHFRLLTG
jgi:3-methyladenine DNA glycosylase AlkC